MIERAARILLARCGFVNDCLADATSNFSYKFLQTSAALRSEDLIPPRDIGTGIEHAYLDASDINVSVKEGEVSLTGKVSDRTDKRLAEDVAESITGVNVQNNLRADKNWETDITARSTAAKASNP